MTSIPSHFQTGTTSRTERIIIMVYCLHFKVTFSETCLLCKPEMQQSLSLYKKNEAVVNKLVSCAVMLRWYFPCRLQNVSFRDAPRWLMGSAYWPITTQLHTFAPKCVLARHRFHSDVFVVFRKILLLEALKQAESYVHKTGKIFLCTCIFLELCVDCKRFKYHLQFGGFDLEQNGPCVFGGKLFDVQQNYVHMIMHFLWCCAFIFL